MSEIQSKEVAVEIRGARASVRVLGSITMGVEMQTRPITTLWRDTSACCEDCPDANDNPPQQSECPYFELGPGGWPICTREGNSDEELYKFFFDN